MKIKKVFIMGIVCFISFFCLADKTNAKSFKLWGRRTRSTPGSSVQEYQGNTVTLKKTATITKVEGYAFEYTIWRVEPGATDVPGTQVPDRTDFDTETPSTTMPSDKAYQEYISAYNKLTKLMAAGRGDTPEAQEAYKQYNYKKDLYEASIKTGVGKTIGGPAGDEHHERPDKDIIISPHYPVVTSKPAGPMGIRKDEHIIRLSPIADCYVYAYSYRNWNKSNRGKYEILTAGWHPTGGETRAYLKFDLSGVDPNSVGKATLKLFHYHTGGNNSLSVGVHEVTGRWQEGSDTYHSGQMEKPAARGEISWVNQPSFDPRPVARFNPGPGVKKWVEVDITLLVKAWLSGTPNNGLVIKPEGNLSGRTPESQYGFYSREFRDTAKRPVLVLSGSGWVQQAGGGPGKDIVLGYPGGKATTTGTGKEISASFTIPPRSGSYAWEHTILLTIPGSGAVVFDAKATNDIHVSFAETASDRSPLYEIVIGGWNNTQTVIRKGRQTPRNGHARVNVKQNSQAMVAANLWATYWVSVNRGLVMVGRGKSVGQNIILTWQDPEPLQNLKIIAFSTWNTPVEFRNIRLRPAVWDYRP